LSVDSCPLRLWLLAAGSGVPILNIEPAGGGNDEVFYPSIFNILNSIFCGSLFSDL